jgi:DNA polymerase-4
MKTILHIDMNCYFVSVELINKPHLAKVPVIVGGKKKRGIVCSANYIARSYGVKAAMPVFSALKKCPNAVLVEPSLGLYSSYHEKFISLIKQNFTNHIEVASIDECYVDITNLIKKKSAQQIAIEIQNLLLSNLNLPCSIGIGNNKFMAKMGSNFKKPLGITQMYQQDKILKL